MHPKLISRGTLLAILAALVLALGPPAMAQSESASEATASENGESPDDATSEEDGPPAEEGPAIPLSQDPDC